MAAAADVLRFQCGDQTVAVQRLGDRTVLTTQSGTFDLHRVEAASGAKYEAFTDASTTFWSDPGQVLSPVHTRPVNMPDNPERNLAGP